METPPVIEPVSERGRRRFTIFGMPPSLPAAFIVLFVGLIACGVITRIPPDETKLIDSFYTHRAAYERLREMLEGEDQVVTVEKSGVRTGSAYHLRVSARKAGLTAERYDEYLALLREVGGYVAGREKGEPADPHVLIWRWGWAGESKHIWIGWHRQAPSNEVPTLTGHHARFSKGEWEVIHRHLDGNWYLCSDL